MRSYMISFRRACTVMDACEFGIQKKKMVVIHFKQLSIHRDGNGQKLQTNRAARSAENGQHMLQRKLLQCIEQEYHSL
jgi:hypothetical protein